MIQDDFRVIGWISVHRQFMRWRWYKQDNMVRLFLHFMLRANRIEAEWMGLKIKPGQFATSLRSLHDDTGISIQSIRTCLKRLLLTQEISIETTHLCSIITVRNFVKYQMLENGVDYNVPLFNTDSTHISTQELTNKSTQEINSESLVKTGDAKRQLKKSTQEPTRIPTQTPTHNNKSNKSNNKDKELKNDSGNSLELTDKKSDYLERIIDLFRAKFREKHSRDYIITNRDKERKAAARILQVFKSTHPGANSETMLQLLAEYFSGAINIPDNWIRNHMSLSIAFSKYNDINNILNDQNKNTHARLTNNRSENPVSNFNTNWD